MKIDKNAVNTVFDVQYSYIGHYTCPTCVINLPIGQVRASSAQVRQSHVTWSMLTPSC